MTADEVQRWLDAYVAAWASYDEAEITALFTDDCAYRYDPFADPLVGGAAIAADWLKDRDAPGSWEAEYRVFAVDGVRAVAVGETSYPQREPPLRQHVPARVRCRRALQLVHRVVLPRAEVTRS